MAIKKVKMKTRSAAKKRFRLTATGKVKRSKAFKSHILTKKSRKRKRSLCKNTLVFRGFEDAIKSMLYR